MEFRLEHGSTEVWGIAWFTAENHRRDDFPWHWGKFPFSERRILIFEFWFSFCDFDHNFHYLSAEFWCIYLEYHCIFWVQNVHFSVQNFEFLARKLLFLSAGILGGLFRAVFGCKICIFQAQNFYFWAQNFHSLSTESRRVWLRHYVMSSYVLTFDLAISIKAMQ